MTVTLTAVGPAARDAWRTALSTDPDALVFQTPEWTDCICASGSYEDATRAYTTSDGHHLVLPLLRRRLPGAAGAAASMPFGWGTGGLISSRGYLAPEEAGAVVGDMMRQRPLVIGVRPAPTAAQAWAAVVPPSVTRTHHMSQSVELSGGFGAVWKRVAPTVRSHCRKAERRGVSVQRDDTGQLMSVFDALYRLSVERWADQQHEPLWLARWRARRRDPAAKFRTAAEQLGPACRVWVAWRSGEPIAATVILTHGQHTTMWRGAMDKDAARGTGATELLHQLALEEACASGHRFYHMGDSAPGSGLAHYKSRFGATDLHYTGYRFERLPLSATDRVLRARVKKLLKFRD